MADTRYFVTGATGWLGRRVLRALTQGHAEMGMPGGHKVCILAAPGEKHEDLTALGVDAFQGDVRDAASMGQFLAAAEGAVVLHLAGLIHPALRVRDFMAVNYMGTRNIVEAAEQAGARRIVVMSSNSPIGASHNPYEVFDEDSPYRPYMGYGRSKHAAELWLRERIAAQPQPNITILRAPWFYGPEQPVRQTIFFSMIREGTFPLMGRGANRRSLGYVDSLAYGILLAAQAEIAAGRIYWLADERSYPMYEIIDVVRTVLRDDFGFAVKPDTIHAPPVIADMARLADRTLQAMGLYHQKIHVLSEMNLTIACSIERARKELGYRPLTDLREGMHRSIGWLLEHGGKI